MPVIDAEYDDVASLILNISAPEVAADVVFVEERVTVPPDPELEELELEELELEELELEELELDELELDELELDELELEELELDELELEEELLVAG